VTTLADILVRHGSEYLKRHDQNILPSHLRVMGDILSCRTESMGGQTWFCCDCNQYHYSYHSCGNRHCPQCQNDRATVWLEKQEQLLLPVTYFMTTFTLPGQLRALAYAHQKKVYNLFFKTSARALQDLALDKRFVGGHIGMVGILQTWDRKKNYHPHIHYIVPGGGLSTDGKKWKRTNKNFLVHEIPLAKRFKGLFLKALQKEGLYHLAPKSVWKKEWVCDVEPVGTGEAALKYLAPYVFRVAISNRNILSLKEGRVTFRYRESETNIWKTETLEAARFIRRFLMHVLPRGFVKVRYYGFLSTKKRKLIPKIKELLGILLSPVKKLSQKASKPFCCPTCGRAMAFIGELPKKRAPPLWMLRPQLQGTF